MKGNKQAVKRAKSPAVPVCVFHPAAVCSEPDREQNREAIERDDSRSF